MRNFTKYAEAADPKEKKKEVKKHYHSYKANWQGMVPIWVCQECGDRVCSINELQAKKREAKPF